MIVKILFSSALEAKSAELSKQELDEAKKRGSLDRKLRTMIREVLWQLILLALMLWVAVGNRDGNVYLQNAHLKHIFVDELPEVSADVCPSNVCFRATAIYRLLFVFLRTDRAQTSSSGWSRS